MKTIFCLLGFFQLIAINLIAQQDSLLHSDTTVVVQKDSIIYPMVSIDNPMFGPGGYIGCIIPLPEVRFNPISVVHSDYLFVKPYNAKGAKQDIRNGEPRILFPGGIVGPDFSSEADKVFQQKYSVKLYSQGCLRMSNDDEAGYNQVIFSYLDKKYGEGWRYELHPDAIGFEEPEKRIVSICKSTDYLTSPLAMQLANPGETGSESMPSEAETSVWWYILPTSGFALLLALYFIKKKKD